MTCVDRLINVSVTLPHATNRQLLPNPQDNDFTLFASRQYHHGECHTFRLTDLLLNYGVVSLADTIEVSESDTAQVDLVEHGRDFYSTWQFNNVPLVENELEYLQALYYCTHGGATQFLLDFEDDSFVITAERTSVNVGARGCRITEFGYTTEFQESNEARLITLDSLQLECRGVQQNNYEDAYYENRFTQAKLAGNVVWGGLIELPLGVAVYLGSDGTSTQVYAIDPRAENHIVISNDITTTAITLNSVAASKTHVVWVGYDATGSTYAAWVFDLQSKRLAQVNLSVAFDFIFYWDRTFILSGSNGVYAGNAVGHSINPQPWLSVAPTLITVGNDKLYLMTTTSEVTVYTSRDSSGSQIVLTTASPIALYAHKSNLIAFYTNEVRLYNNCGNNVYLSDTYYLDNNIPASYTSIIYFRGSYWFLTPGGEITAVSISGHVHTFEPPDTISIYAGSDRVYALTTVKDGFRYFITRHLNTGCKTTALSHIVEVLPYGRTEAVRYTTDFDYPLLFSESNTPFATTLTQQVYPGSNIESHRVSDLSLQLKAVETMVNFETDNTGFTCSRTFIGNEQVFSNMTSNWTSSVFVWDRRWQVSNTINTVLLYDGIFLLRGQIGDIKTVDSTKTEVQILSDFATLNRKNEFRTQASCRHVFGSPECGVDLTPYTTQANTYTATEQPTNTLSFVLLSGTTPSYADPVNIELYANGGTAVFTSGKNCGVSIPILKCVKQDGNPNDVETITNTNSTTAASRGGINQAGALSNDPIIYTLYLATYTPYEVDAGTQVKIVGGCPHSIKGCKFYSNIANFGGMSLLPGSGVLMRSVNWSA